MIQIHSFVFSPFLENTYLVYDETKNCLVIDPGCYEREEKEELKTFIEDNQLNVTMLINTHCHLDHVFGNQFVKDTYDVDLWIHELESVQLKSVPVYAPTFGIVNCQESQEDHYLKEGDNVSFGESQLEILFVPGHAPGHIALVNRDEKICISGDVLFKRSIGRTDLPGGDYNTLEKSVREVLYKLPEDVMVYPGHGESTTIGDEKRENPFFRV